MSDQFRDAADRAADMAGSIPGQRRVGWAEEFRLADEPGSFQSRTAHAEAALARANASVAEVVDVRRRHLEAAGTPEDWVRGAHGENRDVGQIDMLNEPAAEARTKGQLSTVQQLIHVWEHAEDEADARRMVDRLAEHAGEPGLEYLNVPRLREMVREVYAAGGPPAIQHIARGR